MSVDTSAAARSRAENWLAILELSVEEVFEIMLGGRAQPVPKEELNTRREFTAIVGLAGALCGVLTVCCDTATARHLAQCMLGDVVRSESQVSDALGEICNMVAGNFKNKLAGLDERYTLSVPTVISGGEYSLRSLADGDLLETCMLFEGHQVMVSLELHF
jgi:chemotaxis protein CheX